MSKQNELILNALKTLISGGSSTIIATVTSVDELAQTAEVKLDDVGNVTDVIRLKAVIDNAETGFILFPAVGSIVLASKILNGEDYFLISASEVESVWLRGKTNGELINIDDLTSKLNALVDEVDALKSDYTGHTHSGVTSGGSSSGPPATPFTGSFTQFNKDDYKDDKILH